MQARCGTTVVGQVIHSFAPSLEPRHRVGKDHMQLASSATFSRVDHEDWNTLVYQLPDSLPTIAAERRLRRGSHCQYKYIQDLA